MSRERNTSHGPVPEEPLTPGARQAGKHEAFSVEEKRGITLPEGVVALRGQKGPSGDGKDALVLRLIYAPGTKDTGSLKMLGFDEDVLAALEADRASEGGLTIISGPTGHGEAVAALLREFVQSDPDEGMVIRTADEAREALRFAASGHKVFRAIHALDANTVLFRLIALGVDPHDLAVPGVVRLVVSQRLVCGLCPDCALEPTDEQRAIIADWCGDQTARPKLRNRAGCETCLKGRSGEAARAAWGGLAGDRATAEFIQLDNVYRQLVLAGDVRGAREHWLKPKANGGLGGITLDDRMRRLVAQGEIDFEDTTGQTLPGREPASTAAEVAL